MAMLQKEETLLKAIGRSQNSTISSFLNKPTPKSVLSTHGKPITRTKSNSISIKAPLATNETLASPKSPKYTSPSPFAGTRNDQNLYSDRSSGFKSPVTLKETKKASLMNLKKCETPQQPVQVPVQIPEPSAESLDRYTFYSSDFSLFDAKSPSAKSPNDLINGQNNLFSGSLQRQDSKEAYHLQMKTEPEEDIVNTKVLTTSKSCKAYDVPPDLQVGHKEETKIPLTSPKTTKHTVGSPVPISYTSKFTDSFSSRISSKQDRNFSPLLKTQPTPKSTVANHNTAQTYYLPGKKSTYEPKDLRILRSVSPTAAAAITGDGSPKKESKITNYINKNPFLQPSSTDYGKYEKLFKGIQSRGLGKFMPENYKKLGKSYTSENNAKTLRENRLLTSKSTMKGTRNMLGQYLSHREIQSFCDSSSNNKTTNEDQANRVEKVVHVDNIEQLDNFEIISNTISGAQTDNVTCTSVDQRSRSDMESSQKVKSGRPCSIRDTDFQDKGDILSSKRDSWVGKQKETFEEFFSGAMSYMCEVIVSKEAKSPKFDEKTHEEHLNVLLDHIISEILVLKKGIQELSERVRIGKSLLILLEMMLRSLMYLVRKDGNLKSTSRNRSNEKTIGKKDKSSRQDYRVKFEEICGLSGKEGMCEENERNVRDNLCFEIEKRREELDALERELKDGNQTRMLQYVQNIQVKISRVLKDRRR